MTVDVDYDHHSTPRHFEVAIRLTGELDAEQLARLDKVARSCPLRRSIEAGFEFSETIRAPGSSEPAEDQKSPSKRFSDSSSSCSSAGERRPTDRPTRLRSTVDTWSVSSLVLRPRILISGRKIAGCALVEVGTTTTVVSHATSSAWTTTAYRCPRCSRPEAPRGERTATASPRWIKFVHERSHSCNLRAIARIVRDPLGVRARLLEPGRARGVDQGATNRLRLRDAALHQPAKRRCDSSSSLTEMAFSGTPLDCITFVIRSPLVATAPGQLHSGRATSTRSSWQTALHTSSSSGRLGEVRVRSPAAPLRVPESIDRRGCRSVLAVPARRFSAQPCRACRTPVATPPGNHQPKLGIGNVSVPSRRRSLSGERATGEPRAEHAATAAL